MRTQSIECGGVHIRVVDKFKISTQGHVVLIPEYISDNRNRKMVSQKCSSLNAINPNAFSPVMTCPITPRVPMQKILHEKKGICPARRKRPSDAPQKQIVVGSNGDGLPHMPGVPRPLLGRQ